MSPLYIWAAVLVAPNLGYFQFLLCSSLTGQNVKQPQEWEN